MLTTRPLKPSLLNRKVETYMSSDTTTRKTYIISNYNTITQRRQICVTVLYIVHTHILNLIAIKDTVVLVCGLFICSFVCYFRPILDFSLHIALFVSSESLLALSCLMWKNYLSLLARVRSFLLTIAEVFS